MIAPALVGLGVCGLGGLLGPALVARIPEPAADPEEEPVAEAALDAAAVGTGEAAAEEEPKELYAEIAASPGFGPRCALASGLAGAVVGAAVGWDWALLFLLPLVPVLVTLSVVDWRTRLLPTWVIARTYVALVVGVLLAALLSAEHVDLVRAAWGWLVAGASFFVLWFVHPRGLGYGDVRLSGVLGLALGYLGWGELLTGLYSGFLLGGVGGGLLALAGLADRKGVPFGPFMVLGALVGVVTGSWVWAHLVDGWA